MTSYMQGSEGKIIPPSQRPDGTWRKARRVKDGYVPQEEVPLYESKGKLFAQRRPTGPVGGGGGGMTLHSSSSSHSPSVGVAAASLQKTSSLNPPTNHGPGLVTIKQSKPAKPKPQPQPQPAKTASNNNKQGKATTSSAATSNSATQQLATQMERISLTADEEKDPEKLLKHVKKLRKKLREIDNIEQKIKSGEIKTPDRDQLDKVGRKELIRTEVERLEQNPLLVQAEAVQMQKQQQQQQQSPT